MPYKGEGMMAQSGTIMVEETEPPGTAGSRRFPDHNNKRVMPVPGRNGHTRTTRKPSASRAREQRVSCTVAPTVEFRKRHFPSVSDRQWNSWQWQVKNRIRKLEDLERIVSLTEDERDACTKNGGTLPLAITPYYASLIDPKDPYHSLRKTVIPVTDEFVTSKGEAVDPLHEEEDSPLEGLVHRYPDRVLFLVTDFCSTYCRYCTRSRMVGRRQHRFSLEERWERCIDYIAQNPSVRDVLISGGDPLTLPDERLDWLLSHLRRIPHVEVLRIGTKAPVVLPQRITPSLVRILRRNHPLWMSVHFTHPDELTPEVAAACRRLADAGIPLLSQTVLLSEVNDSADTIMRLCHGLVRMRVRPYYLYQCDPIQGSAHFRAPVEKGIDIMNRLQGFTSGFAIPMYVIDAPGGGGKIPMLPQYVAGRDGDDLICRNYRGDMYRYHDPIGNTEAGEEDVARPVERRYEHRDYL